MTIKELKVNNKKLSKDRKIYLNVTITFKAHTPIIKIKGVRFYVVSLIAGL